MVVRKRNWLTHAILIILIVAILFPVVWVVSTSLRRDNAAFSSKLFSSRMSLQNYKDLLFPEDNVLRLLSDIESITTNSRPYDEKSVEFLVEKFDKDIEALKVYSKESKELISVVDNEYETIKSYLSENSDNLIQTVVEQVNKLNEKINIEKSDNNQLIGVAIISLLEEGRINEKDVQELSLGFDYKDYEDVYVEELKTKLDNIESLKRQLQEDQAKLNQIKKDLDFYQEEYTRLSLIIDNSIIPQFESFNKTLQVAYDLLNNLSNQIKAVVSEKDAVENFEEVYSIVENMLGINLSKERKAVIDKMYENMTKVKTLWDNFTLKNSANYADFISLINQFNLKALKQVRESYNLLKNFSEIEREYLKLSNEYILFANKIVSKNQDLEELTRKYLEEERKYLPAKAYIMSLLLKDDIESFINKVEKYTLPKDINKLYLAVKILSRNVNDFLGYVDDDGLKKDVRSNIRKLDWVATLNDFRKKYEKFAKDVKEFIDEFDKYISSIESTGKAAIYSSKNGVKVRIAALLQLFTKVQSEYPANIASSMSIASKAAADLVDQFPVNDLDKSFKNVDKKLFRFDQIWKQKQKYYLWRWIFNSVIVAGVVAIITTIVNALAAYPFSRMRFRGRKYGIMSLLLIQMFPAIMYMIALYGFLSFIGRYIPSIGLNTLGGLIFVYLGNIAFNMYLIKGFYDTIPSSLEEAAMIDGATRWQTFWRIVIPLASPILSVVVILTFMGTFNEFVLAKIILQDVEKYTYAVGLWTFSSGPFETEWGLFSAAALVGMLPMVILFLSMQKYLVGGLTKGSVKG